MTYKKMREQYRRLLQARWQMQKALNDAHQTDLIRYTDNADSPCRAFGACYDLIKKTTKESIVEAFHEDVLKEIR